MTIYVTEWLEAVACSIRQRGWHKAADGAASTASHASNILVHENAEVALEDVKTAAAAIAWVYEMEPTSEFEGKLKSLVMGEVIENGALTTTAALIPTWQRRMQELKQHTSKWMYNLKERVTIAGEVLESRLTTSTFGDSYLTKVNVGGNLVVFYYKEQLNGTIKFTGTVASHDEWRGEKSTRVNRVKIV